MTLIERVRALTPPSPIQLAIGAVITITGVLLLLIVFGGQHDKQAATDTIAAAPIQAKTAAVAKARDVALAPLTEKTHAAITTVRRRTSRAVEELHVAIATPAGDPDRAFYVGMCRSPFYAGSADCLGYRGGPEGGRSSDRP